MEAGKGPAPEADGQEVKSAIPEQDPPLVTAGAPAQLLVLAHEPPNETALTVNVDGVDILTVWDGDRSVEVNPTYAENKPLIRAAQDVAQAAIELRTLAGTL